MPNTNVDSEIRVRVETFVDDLTELIRTSAVEAVRGALTGGATAPARRGRPKASAKKPKVRKGKRIRRTTEQVEQLAASIQAHVTANSGQRLGDIAKALKVATKDARRPAFALVGAGKLKTTGQRGGTRYFAKGASTASAPKKTRKRKVAKRKVAKRKTRKGKAA